ncbi:MAG: hypothetical protein A2X79_08435 [Desulfuromonadaceae bacterium GWB2_53_15]|nr:MAG: hypothetical protein A2X79_08435 [Desulfuromonadaceae bacterium GWB2_53_15]
MSVKPQVSVVTARLIAAFIGTIGSFILFAAYMIIPPAGFLSGLLAPFPAIYFRFRDGRATAVIITLGTATLLAGILGPQAGALYLLQNGMIALMMPELLIRGYNASRTIAWTTAVNLTIFALAAWVFSLISGQNLHQLAVNEINSSIAQAVAIYEKAGVKGDELDLLKQSMTMAAKQIARIYPALTTFLLMAMAGCNLALIKRFSVKLGTDLKLGNFNEFKNHELLIWLLIAAGFAQLAATPIITIPALNVLVIITMLYFIQGLAAISAIISRQPFAGVMRVMLYLMLLFQPYLAALIAAFGIFDLWGDFRTPRKQENL